MVTRLEPERHRQRRRVGNGARADRLSHCIDAGVRGRRGRKAMGEHRVDERVLRAHVGMTEADLHVRVGIRENARAGDLTPRPRGRRAEDERRCAGGAGVMRPSAKSRPVPPWSAMIRAAFATSSAEPPPIPTTAQRARQPHALRELVRELERRLARVLHDSLERDPARLDRGQRRRRHRDGRRPAPRRRRAPTLPPARRAPRQAPQSRRRRRRSSRGAARRTSSRRPRAVLSSAFPRFNHAGRQREAR